MSTVEKFKELFSANRRLIKRLLKVIEYKKSNDILASMVIERRGQKIKKLKKDKEVIADDNDELRNKNLGYESGRKDPETIPRKVAEHKQKNQWDSISVGGGKIKEVRINQYENVPYEVWESSTPTVQKIGLDDILKLCTTNKQRQVVKFYYDKDIDSYDSYQRTADYLYPGDENGRQKVYDIIKRIKAQAKEVSM